LLAGCLDTASDPIDNSASDAGTAGRGSTKPPLAPARNTAGSGGASPSGSAKKGPQAGRPAAASGENELQPAAAGARAIPVGQRPSTAGSRAPAGEGAAGHADMPRLPSPTRAGELVITELMIDPRTLPDTQGEWFELYNASDSELSLQDCQIDDGVETLHAVMEPVLLPPREYVTLARGPNPGFMPTAMVSLSLTNTADTLAIICRGVEIDRVSYSKAAGFQIEPGATLALDPDALSAQQNDSASAWCTGRDLYDDDLGTPGRANPSCHAEDEQTQEAPVEELDAGMPSEEA
jgi:hypothetical protein